MNQFFKCYKYFHKYILKYKFQYILSIVIGLALIFAYNFSIFQIKGLINGFTTGSGIISALIMILLIVSLPLVLEPLTFYFKRFIDSKTVQDLHMALYTKVMNLDYAFHTEKETGRLISKVLRITEVMDLYVWQIGWFLLMNICNFLIPISIISIISWQIGLGVFIALAISLPIEIWAIKKNVGLRKLSKEAEYDKNTVIVDTLTNYETVRLFGKATKETNNLSESLNIFTKASLKYEQSYAYLDFAARFSGLLMLFTGSIIGYFLINKNMLDFANYIVIITYLLSLSAGTISLIFSIRAIFQSMPVVEDVYELLHESGDVVEPESPVVLANPKGKIEFKNVSFKYPNDRKNNAVTDLSIRIEAGESIALVGPSGGGKSTLARLLLRYYPLDNGSISIDDIDINDLTTSTINGLVGVVPQEPILFNRSLKFNIGYALGNSDKTIDEHMDLVIEASKRARIHDFIMTLPRQYDTSVGERGIKLSGGQKQRIAIARAMIKEPKIVIFDEATSMLDSESEAAIQLAFAELSKDTTTIVIAHRLSTIKNSDKIFVIDNGRVIENGKHQELINQSGLYARLWNLQNSGFKN